MAALLLVLFQPTPLLAQGDAATGTLSLDIDDADLKDDLTEAAKVFAPQEEATPGDIVAVAKGDYARLVGVLYDAGYFSPVVSIRMAGREVSELSAIDPPSNLQPVTISVNTGAQFTFGQAEIGPLAPGTTPPEGFESGAPAQVDLIRDAAGSAVSDWRDASHAKAGIAEQSVTARHDQNRLDVVLRVDPGPALRFGELREPTDSAVSARRITKIAGLAEGEPYSPKEVSDVRERLVRTGAFSSVVVREADVPNADDTLDIIVEVQDAPPRRISFGAELQSTEGLSLQANWMHRNLFGGAEQLRFDASVEGIGNDTTGLDFDVAGSLRIPGWRRHEDTLIAGAQIRSLDEPTYESDIATIGIGRERRVNDRITTYIGTGLRFEDSTTVLGEDQFQHVVFEARATADGRDDPLSPRAGYYAALNFLPYIGVAGSESGIQTRADGRLYRGIGASTVLAGRLQVGNIFGTEIAETPPDLLFLSGGGGTVRGHDYLSLGVELDEGTIGGLSFVGLSAELRQGISGNLGIVAFADMGLIGPDTEFGDMESHAGFGLGARYNTGFGPLRIDIGLPDEDPSLENIQLYIGLGEAF